MALRSTSRPPIRGKVIPRIPATFQATGGLYVSKENGVWTLEPDWTQLALEVSLPDPEDRQLWVFSPDENQYVRLSMQTLIDAMPPGPQGQAGGFRQNFDSSTSDADPGDGEFRFNHATPSSATAIYFDNVDTAGGSVTTAIDRFDDSTSTVRGDLRIESEDDSGIWAIFSVTGSVVDGTGYRKVTVTSGASLGTFVAGDPFRVVFFPKGDKGNTGEGAEGVADGPIANGKIVVSVAANALTIALKTLADADPDAGDPVVVTVPAPSAGEGATTILSIEAAVSLIISNGSTVGTEDGIPFNLWLVGFNNGGSLAFGLINCRGTAGVYSLDSGETASSTAEGGAGAADSAGAYYTTSAVTDKPYTILAKIEFHSGQATAGAWVDAPDLVRQFARGMLKPGDIRQTRSSISTTPTTNTATSYTATGMTCAISVTNPGHAVAGAWTSNMQIASFSGHYGAVQAFNDTLPVGQINVVNVAGIFPISGMFLDTPGMSGTVTYTMKTKAGVSGQNVTMPYNAGEAANGVMMLAEIVC